MENARSEDHTLVTIEDATKLRKISIAEIQYAITTGVLKSTNRDGIPMVSRHDVMNLSEDDFRGLYLA